MSDSDIERFHRQPMQIMTACDQNRHKLEPRYDTHRLGEVFQRVYVCDVCCRCGHMVPRPMTTAAALEAGLIGDDEARALWLAGLSAEEVAVLAEDNSPNPK